jgi:hypothetical protein
LRLGVGVEFEKGDEPETRDDDGTAAEGDDAEDGDFAAHRHVQVPDGGDGEEEDVDVFDDVLGCG